MNSRGNHSKRLRNRSNRLRTFLGTALPLTVLLCGFVGAGCESGHPEDAAERAALAWLETVDHGQYRASWEQGAPLFQKSLTATRWEDSLRAVRGPLGAVRSRKLKNAHFTTSLPGAPAGKYVVLQFETSFENRPGVIETVTPMLEDGKWRVSGYYVR